MVAGINTKLLRVGTTWFCFALAGMPEGGMVCGFRTVTLVFMPDFGKRDRKEEKKYIYYRTAFLHTYTTYTTHTAHSMYNVEVIYSNISLTMASLHMLIVIRPIGKVVATI